jgi:hypothetical protein
VGAEQSSIETIRAEDLIAPGLRRIAAIRKHPQHAPTNSLEIRRILDLEDDS